MKQLIKFSLIVLIAVLLRLDGFSQVENKTPETRVNKEKTPAEKIEKYWFVLLKTGPKQDFDSAAKSKLFEGHMANISKLYYDGILKAAGPFGKNDLTWRGLFVFDCKTKEEVEKYTTMDPAIAAGLFVVDIVPWYSEPIGSFKHGKPEKEKEN